MNSVFETRSAWDLAFAARALSTLATLEPEGNIARFLNAASEEDELKDRLPGGKKKRPSTAGSPLRDCEHSR